MESPSGLTPVSFCHQSIALACRRHERHDRWDQAPAHLSEDLFVCDQTAHLLRRRFALEATRFVGRLAAACSRVLATGERDEPQLEGPHHRLRPVGGLELEAYVLHVVFGGTQADHQFFGDLAVGAPQRH